MQKKKFTFIGMIIIVLICAGCIIYNLPGNRMTRQLNLGVKYFAEMKYEEAIVAFHKVIEIDPRCKEAYFGLADVYITQKDYDVAREILEKGYEIIQDEEFESRLEEIKELMYLERVEVFKENNVKQCEKIIEAYTLEDYVNVCEMTEPVINEYNELQSEGRNLGIPNREEKVFVETKEGKVGIYKVFYSGHCYYYVYCGDYNEDMRQGEGMYFSSHKNEMGEWSIKYGIGGWKNDKPDGKFKIYSKHPDYIVEQGEVVRNIIDGEGKYQIEEIEGITKNGIWDGEVSFTYSAYTNSKGNYYSRVGFWTFMDGKIEIIDTYQHEDGTLYGIGNYTVYRNGQKVDDDIMRIEEESLNKAQEVDCWWLRGGPGDLYF